MKLFSQSLSPPSFYLFISVIFGIIVGRWIPPNIYFPITFICVFIVSVSLFVHFFHKPAIYIFCALFLSIGIFFVHSVFYPNLDSNHIVHLMSSQKSNGQQRHVLKKMLITGQVKSFTRHYHKKNKLVLSLISIQDSTNKSRSVSGKINLTIYGTQLESKFGDVIKFKSIIRPLRNFSNPGGFDYVTYIKLKGIYGSAYTYAKNLIISEDNSHLSYFYRILRKIEKTRFAYFQHILLNPYKDGPYKNGMEKSILISLITGKKEVLSPALRDLFSKAGISHLLAISGLHLSIVGFLLFNAFYQILSFFPQLLVKGRAKKLSLLFTIIPIAGYAIFSGFSASTQRAFIMTIVLLFSFTREKDKDIFSSLCSAGILILFINPAALFSISFQLSFSAVLFIICGISILKPPRCFHTSKIRSIGFSLILVTFLAGLGTLPFVAHYFNIISHIQLLTNIIAIPLTTFVFLPLGFLGFAFYSWVPAVSTLVIGICLKAISFLIFFANACVELPFSWSRVSSFSWVEICIFYMGIFSIYFFLKLDRKKAVTLLILALLILFIDQVRLYGQHKRPPLLSITTIDIGQGNSAVIQTPDQKNILVDGGGFSGDSGFDTGRSIIAPYLWKNDITQLDYVILSHPEADHLNGLVFILNNFNVATLIKNTDVKKSTAYLSLMKACKKNNINILNPNENKRQFNIGQTSLLFFPSRSNNKSAKKVTNFNNNSLVFKIHYKKFTMLFAGDILKEREGLLSHQYASALKSQILLAPHHGSNTSSTKVFLDKVQPKSVIISCALRNRYGFPHALVLERYKTIGATIFRTDNDGAIIIKSDGSNHQIKTFKGG